MIVISNAIVNINSVPSLHHKKLCPMRQFPMLMILALHVTRLFALQLSQAAPVFQSHSVCPSFSQLGCPSYSVKLTYSKMVEIQPS